MLLMFLILMFLILMFFVLVLLLMMFLFLMVIMIGLFMVLLGIICKSGRLSLLQIDPRPALSPLCQLGCHVALNPRLQKDFSQTGFNS